MNNRLVLNFLRFVGLLLLQVSVIDNIRLGYYIPPYVYVLFIFMLPFNIPNWQLLFAGFFMGLTVDLFSGTPGLNAAACVLIAFVRPWVIKGIMRRKDISENDEPSLNSMGTNRFVVYSLLLLVVHNLMLFMLEAFSFRLIGVVILQTLLSVFSSLMLIFIILLLFKKTKKKSL